jgi:hypothetical protein
VDTGTEDGPHHDARMISRFGRAERRPAPPSVRLYDDVDWAEPHDVAVPLWRRVLSAVELVLMVVLLGVAITIATGVVLVVAFFLLDMVVG